MKDSDTTKKLCKSKKLGEEAMSLLREIEGRLEGNPDLLDSLKEILVTYGPVDESVNADLDSK